MQADTLPPSAHTGDKQSTYILIQVSPNSEAHQSIAIWSETALTHLGDRGLVTLIEINDRSHSGALVAFAQLLCCVDFLAMRLYLLQQLGGSYDR